ncbi:XkdF-like putative serine protease domain-containing protein [Hymenobacter pini]|uniref:XkdF-like putative serine protease domain-containing protein n=1 Tax=Hymenobacter pini TaxID=2880879 RepID=UPI001CF4E29C|nr:XkdF-like putative serine protease domain-containing protein [Hymenobacter pini]MCA8829435.1 XkdF-like putative serine protease domain-containing protein [Hymenobacter pini]
MYAVQFAPAAPEVGVSLVSFVDKPAIGVDFVALSAEQTLPVALKADAKKQVLTGPVLIPDKQIARLDDKGQLYYLTFSAEVIEQMHERFHEQQNTHATNLQHDTALEGNFCKESWLVTDASQDKAYALGFTAEQVPVGTWMASYKVTDAKLWADEVETGNVKGFSMEGLLAYTTLSAQLSSIQPTQSMPQKPKGIFARFMAFIGAISLAMLTLDDDSQVEVDDTTGEVFTLDAEGNRGELLADGTYKLKGGGELAVKDGKKVDAAAESTTDTTATAAAAVPAAEQKLADATTEAPATTAVEASSITLEGGEVITHDPIGKKLYKADGTLLPTGKYKTDKGVMFKVTTDQWWYETQETMSAQITAQEVAISGKDAEIQNLTAKLAEAELKLKAKPATTPVKLAGDKGAEKAEEAAAEVPTWKQRLSAARANGKKAQSN